MKPGLGWVHIKDYRHDQAAARLSHIDEASLKNFVPADIGDTVMKRFSKTFYNRDHSSRPKVAGHSMCRPRVR